MSSADPTIPLSYSTVGSVRQWFSVATPVSRRHYWMVGVGLALLKYTIELFAIFAITGKVFSPADFVNPWLSSKAPFLMDAPNAGLIWLAFTVPFVWVAICMSVRRAADIGISPWWGMSMLIPLVNLVAMAILAILPRGLTRHSPKRLAEQEKEREHLAEAFRPPLENTDDWVPNDFRPPSIGAGIWLAAIASGTATQVVVGAVSVWLMQSYGFILFFSAPVIAGAVAGFVFCASERQSISATICMLLIMNVISFVIMLSLGLDGAVCLIMAFPLLGPLSIMGGFVGAAIALASLRPGVNEKRGAIGMVILLPVCLLLEPMDDYRPLHQVTTSVDIAAAPEVVWNQVTSFPDIDTEMAWYFRLGIAAPLRARIEGTGVGATRHCEFTTGDFVEPITLWDQPRRLAFNVSSQPHPMLEWTPFEHLHPPHLDTGFVSKRGEFRLDPLPGGGTRLHGTTWYEIDVRPRLYWKGLADPMLHAIHRRVLNHIAEQATK